MKIPWGKLWPVLGILMPGGLVILGAGYAARLLYSKFKKKDPVKPIPQLPEAQDGVENEHKRPDTNQPVDPTP